MKQADFEKTHPNAYVSRAEVSLVLTLTRDGAMLLGLEVDPYPEKYVPIVLTGNEALVAAEYIAQALEKPARTALEK